MGNKRTARLAAMLVAGALVLSACGRSEPTGAAGATGPASSASPATTRASAVATTKPMTEEEKVVAAYRSFWVTWDRANDPPDPEFADLERFVTGAALEKARASITKNKADGVRFREPQGQGGRHEPSRVVVDGPSASLLDCSIDDGQVIAADGQVRDSTVQTNLFEVTLQQADDQWRVANVKQLKQWPGETTCDG
ncbi:MAG: hypothetical protein HYX32_11655 [Actinobacteria bacterium]|nr:hypothetical protein [Actinomycetota bacterium]